MITLTRLRQNTPFILNPDLIERVDTHVDTVVRLTSGTEYLVNETGDEIVRLTAEFRARVLALAGKIDTWALGRDDEPAAAPATAPVTDDPGVDDVPVDVPDDVPVDLPADVPAATGEEVAP